MRRKKPNPKELRIIDELSLSEKYSQFISPKSTLLERLKYMLCQKIVMYKYQKNLTQRDLANLLNIDEARISEVVHYKFDKFSVDKLLHLVEVLDPKTAIQVS